MRGRRSFRRGRRSFSRGRTRVVRRRRIRLGRPGRIGWRL